MTEEEAAEEAKREEAEHESWNIGARGIFCATLSEALRDMLAKAVEVGDVTPETRDAMAGWLENANPEALVAWLDNGGLEKVNKAELDTELAKAFDPLPTWTNYPAPESWVDMEGIWHLERGTMFAMRTRREELRTRRAKLDPPEELETRRKELKDIVGRLQTKRAELNDLRENYDELLKPDPAPMVVRLIAKGWWLSLMRGLRTTDDGKGILWPDGKPARWLKLLAAPWLQEAAEREAERQAERQQLEAARMEREAKARPLALRTVRTANGEEYARLPKLAAGISWAFGGAGVQLPEGYKAAPNIAALVPPGYALLKETDLARPHQAALPRLVEGDDSPPLMLAVAGTNRDVFTPAAAALAVYVMASNWDKPDVLQETTLRELTRAIYPDAPRLRADKHYAAVAEALGMMRNARILWPNGYADALFYVPRWTWKTPDPEALDAPLVVGLDQHFLQRTLPDIAAATGGKSLAGQFVFNLTGAMSLDKDRPGLLRQYLRAVATGDAFWAHGTGKPSPDMVPEVDAVRWAVLTNYLPGGHGLHGKDPRPTGRVAKSNALKRMLADIAYLEGKGLVKVGTASKKAVRLLLTPEHLDAWDAFRAGKARKAKV